LGARQDWALSQLQEWYLFPDLLNASINAAAYSSVEAYIDALVAPARAQNRDRYFTYLTSIEEENAYYEQGATAGFGIRLEVDQVNRRLFVNEVFEGSNGYAAGFDRGTEILRIGTSAASHQSVDAILASGGTNALAEALGPGTTGTSRYFEFRDSGGVVRTGTVSKSVYELDPVSDVYGARIIADGAKNVGYINLRTFIDTAEPDLRAAFATFKAQGITELIIDLRYNGGGLISIGELMGDLMGAGRAGQVFQYTTFRSSKSSLNETYTFQPTSESLAPAKVAFIATGSTASASEMVINGMVPYLGSNMALIGENTYGKPVGQIALDRAACDDRLRAVALKIENANHQGDYYNGLATTVGVTCRASDDIAHPLGDPDEEMVRAALDFLAGRSCTAISTAKSAASVGGIGFAAQRGPLTRAAPENTPQRELPGAF
jgi:C-terminal processing protease CtpA/Prc